MAITVLGKKESFQPGNRCLMGLASFDTSTQTGTINVGKNRKVINFVATWTHATTVVSDYAPQAVGTVVQSSNATSYPAYIKTDSSGNITVVRAGSTSGSTFFFRVDFE